MKQKKQEPTQTKIRRRHHKMKLYAGVPKGFRKEIGNLDRFEHAIRDQIRTGKRKVRPIEMQEDK